MLNKTQMLNDLNFTFFGAVMGVAIVNGALNHPASASICTFLTCGFIYFKYLNNKTETINQKEETVKYQMPSSEQIAQKILQKNPTFSENPVTRRIELQIHNTNPLVKKEARRIQNNNLVLKEKLENLAVHLNENLVEEKNEQNSNVVDFQSYKSKRRNFSPPEAG